MQTRQIYASITGVITGTVYVELPTNAKIKGIQLVLMPTAAGTAADYCSIEVSTNSSNQVATSDAVGVLAGLAGCIGAAGVQGWSQWIACDCQLKAGDRIYLNATENGGSTWLARAIIHYH